MIWITTVVTLRDNGSIDMLAREILLLTQLQVIINYHCYTRGFLDLSKTSLLDIEAKEDPPVASK